MRLRAVVLLSCGLAAIASVAVAGNVTLPINHTLRLGVAGSAASVVVGNPAVADVTVVDSHTVFVSGRGAGSTDVTVLDGLGRTLYASEITVPSPLMVGHVSLYRGAQRSDLACNPDCTSNGQPTQRATAATAAAAPAATANPASLAAGLMAGALLSSAANPLGGGAAGATGR